MICCPGRDFSAVVCRYSCVTALSSKSAKDLELMTKDQFKQVCGESEGSRVFSQFAVQKANWKVKEQFC